MLRRVFEISLIITLGFASYEIWNRKPVSGEIVPQKTPNTVKSISGSEADKPEIALPASSELPSVDQQMMEKIFAKFATGDFVGAINLADASALDPKYSEGYHSWLQNQLPSLLTSAGWTTLKMGDCESGTTYFLRSQAIESSVKTMKGLAVCYYKMRNFMAASEWFQKYIALKPNDEQIKILYTDVLESEGRFPEAVAILKEITEHRDTTSTTDDNDPLKMRLASMRGRAKENKHQTQEHSLHFNISYRAEEHDELVAYVLNLLEEALTSYMDAYGFLPPISPIDVILYPKETFSEMIVGGPDWAVGLFDGRLRIPIDPSIVQTGRYDELDEVLRHELVHALIALKNDHRQLPSWLEEGMAQRIACAKQGCAPYKFSATPGKFLKQIEFTTPFTSYSSQKARRAYKQSLYLMYSLETQFGSDVLERLTGQITKSRSLSSDDMLKPFNISFSDLHKKTKDSWERRDLLKAEN